MPEIVVIGAGLAGLTCARELHAAGREVLLLERSDGVGGRVRTDLVDGFRLDRGFQIYLTAYPSAGRLLDLDALELKPFYQGALVQYGGERYRIADPLRHPLAGLGSLRAPFVGGGDLIGLARLIARARGPLGELFRRPEMTAAAAIATAGVSPALLDAFFRPFFGGIFLERELTTSSRMLDFLLRMFARGQAVVPAKGMQEIPAQLAAGLPQEAVRLHTGVVRIEPGAVVLTDEQRIEARRVVVAADGAAAADLLGEPMTSGFCATTTIYFDAPEPVIGEPVLVLNGGASGEVVVNNVTEMSAASSRYAPPGRTLISASVIGRPQDPSAPEETPEQPDELVSRATAQLRDWFGPAVDGWRHLRSYRLPRALPAQPPGTLEPAHRPVQRPDGVLVCGDHRATASIEGAMVSGWHAAQAILRSPA